MGLLKKWVSRTLAIGIAAGAVILVRPETAWPMVAIVGFLTIGFAIEKIWAKK